LLLLLPLLLLPVFFSIVLSTATTRVVSHRTFALGGCAKLHTKESYLGVPKIEAQAATVARNIRASMNGTKVQDCCVCLFRVKPVCLLHDFSEIGECAEN
jgi:hypothetical protein